MLIENKIIIIFFLIKNLKIIVDNNINNTIKQHYISSAEINIFT